MDESKKGKRTLSGLDKFIKVTMEDMTSAINFIYSYAKNYNVYLVAVDKRDKTYSQVKFMYAILKEFCKEYSGTTDKETIDEVKNAFYADYARAMNLPIYRTVTASVTQMRLFLDWLIKTLALDFGFAIALELIEADFLNSWIYANTSARICCVCGKRGAEIHHVEAVGAGRNRKKIDHTKHKVISLCSVHHSEEHTTARVLSDRGLVGVNLSVDEFKRLNYVGEYHNDEKHSRDAERRKNDDL